MIQDERVRSLYQRASMLAGASRPKEALATLRAVLASEPESVEAHCLAAQCLLLLGQPAKADDEAAAAIRCDPTAEWPHRLRSSALHQSGNRPAAIEAALDAIRLAPRQYRGHMQLAELLARDGQRKPALDAARRAVELSPGTAAPYVMLSLVASLTRQWPECERAARRALQIEPDSAPATNNLGVALLHRRRRLLALSLFSRSASTDPMQPLMRANINTVAASLMSIATGLAFSAVVLVTLLLTGSTRGVATPVAAVLTALVTGSFLTLLWSARVWYRRLPRVARNAVRDRGSWAATLNKPELPTRQVVTTLIAVQIWSLLTWGGGLLIVAAALNTLGGTRGNQPPEESLTLFLLGLGILAYVSFLRWVARRKKTRIRNAQPQARRKIDVDWP